MKNLALLLITTITLSNIQAQRFEFEINTGVSGNFFVRSYEEFNGPQNSIYFYKKRFLGEISGFEIKYNFKDSSAFFWGFSRSINKEKKNYTGQINGVAVLMNDFSIRHINNFFNLGYDRRLRKLRPFFSYHFGIFILSMAQQEISFEPNYNLVTLDERTFKNSKLIEAGVFWGFQFQKRLNQNFNAGLKIRAYYLVSTKSMEAITFTPTLTYSF